jgi:methyl-accepting chemotaxis protein
MSLKQRLLAFVAILLLTVIAALSGMSYREMRSEIVAGVSHEIEAAVRGNREALSRWIIQRRDAIDATATRLVSGGDPIPFLLAGKDAGRFDQLFVGYGDKRMIYNLADKQPPEGYDPTARPWYKQASDAKGTVVTPPYISASTKKLGITIARPVEGEGAGVVGGDISLEEIVDLVKAIQLRGDGYAFLATRDGKIVAHSAPDSALKPVAEIMPGFDASILQSADDKFVLREFPIDGRTKFVITSSITGVDWVLCAVVDKSAILSPLKSLLGMLALSGLIIAVLGALLANAALSRLLKDLFGLRDALTEISSGQGDLTRKLSTKSVRRPLPSIASSNPCAPCSSKYGKTPVR